MIRIILLFALLVAPFFTASSNEKSLVNSIDNIFSELNLEAEPACAVGLIKNNEYLFKRGYGLSNLEHKIALTPDSVLGLVLLVNSSLQWRYLYWKKRALYPLMTQ